PVALGIEPVDARDRVYVAVEHEADEPAVGIDERTARVAADDIVGSGEIELRVQVEPPLEALPARRDLERLLTGRTLKEARQVGERLDLAALFVPALHRSEAQ